MFSFAVVLRLLHSCFEWIPSIYHKCYYANVAPLPPLLRSFGETVTLVECVRLEGTSHIENESCWVEQESCQLLVCESNVTLNRKQLLRKATTASDLLAQPAPPPPPPLFICTCSLLHVWVRLLGKFKKQWINLRVAMRMMFWLYFGLREFNWRRTDQQWRRTGNNSTCVTHQQWAVAFPSPTVTHQLWNKQQFSFPGAYPGYVEGTRLLQGATNRVIHALNSARPSHCEAAEPELVEWASPGRLQTPPAGELR